MLPIEYLRCEERVEVDIYRGDVLLLIEMRQAIPKKDDVNRVRRNLLYGRQNVWGDLRKIEIRGRLPINIQGRNKELKCRG